jgi:hypothetical protein
MVHLPWWQCWAQRLINTPVLQGKCILNQANSRTPALSCLPKSLLLPTLAPILHSTHSITKEGSSRRHLYEVLAFPNVIKKLCWLLSIVKVNPTPSTSHDATLACERIRNYYLLAQEVFQAMKLFRVHDECCAQANTSLPTTTSDLPFWNGRASLASIINSELSYLKHICKISIYHCDLI